MLDSHHHPHLDRGLPTGSGAVPMESEGMLANAKNNEFSHYIRFNRGKTVILDIHQDRLNTSSIDRFGRIARPGGVE